MPGDPRRVYSLVREANAEEEVHEIKKEIVESRGLIIRTNNLVNSLSADVKTISKRQASYERRLTWTSGTAYALFALLSFAGLKLASDARVQEIESEKDSLATQVQDLRKALTRETKTTESKRRARQEAKSFYKLIDGKKRREAVKRFNDLPMDRFSSVEASVFRNAVDEFRRELAMSTMREGIDLMRTGRYAEAAAKFRKALDYRDDKEHGPLFRYHLALALQKLGRHTEALVLAKAVAERQEPKDLQADALWLVNQSAQDVDDLDEARGALQTILRKHPRSSYVPDARKQLRDVRRNIRRGRGN